MRLSPLLFVVLTSLASTAHAEEAYEGRKLPETLKKFLWAKACDVVPKQSVDCAVDRCIFKDSAGQAFNPDMQPWQTVLMYEWNVGGNVLTPAVVEGKLAGPDEVGDPRTALGLLSGLTVDLDPNDYLMQLNPAVVRWVGRELIPPPDAAMCGATAKEVYERGFRSPVRQAMDVYAQLKAKGITRGVREAELAKNFNEQRGRLAGVCQAIAKKSPDDERWGRETLCWWWMRRAVSGSADEIAMLLGKVLADFDAEALKKYAKVIPKPVALKPGQVTPKPLRKVDNPW